MKGIKVLLGLSITAVGISAVSLGVASTNKTSLNTVSAAAPTNQRRIWILNNDNWWVDNIYGVEVSNGVDKVYTSAVDVVLPSYYHGFGFVDVSIANATSALSVRVLYNAANHEYSENNQTVELNLPAFGGADVIWMHSGTVMDSGISYNCRNATVGTTNGFGGTELGKVLAKYNTCSSATTNGYNAFPQLKTNIFDKTDSGAFDALVEGQSTYTCRDYADGMKTRYEADL